jgi:hypothetical protein
MISSSAAWAGGEVVFLPVVMKLKNTSAIPILPSAAAGQLAGSHGYYSDKTQ